MIRNASIHTSADVSEKADIGDGTKVWHQAQVREGAIIGKNCNIGKGVYIDTNVVIGDNCKIQNYACLYNGLTVGNNVFIGPGVVFTNDKYPDALVWNENRLVKTVVEDGVSIGANSTIRCGVTLHKCSMIGAGSVVVTDIPQDVIAYGNPAQVTRKK